MTAITRNDFDFIRELVYHHSAIALDADKSYLVESRLITLARQEGLASLKELIEHLRGAAAKGLQNKVIEAMTTNETSFFRDIHPFEALKSQILPELRASSKGGLDIWCAACSSGQEPYSIAMLMWETFPELAKKTQLLATDLSKDMLALSESGCYSQLEVNRGLPVQLLMKYFDKKGLKWQAKQQLRDMLLLRQLNLASQWPAMPQKDIIFMRNVLIYFDVKTKKAILGKVRRLLKPDGYLFLGAAETTLNLDNGFKRVMIDKSTCYRLFV